MTLHEVDPDPGDLALHLVRDHHRGGKLARSFLRPPLPAWTAPGWEAPPPSSPLDYESREDWRDHLGPDEFDAIY